MKTLKRLMIFAFILIFSTSIFADYKAATPEQVAKLTICACALSRNIQEMDGIDIYVMGNRKIANALQKYNGQQIGKVEIKSIKFGNTLPRTKPTVLVCGYNSHTSSVRDYCRKNNVLSIGARPIACNRGLSLSMCREVNDENDQSLSQVKVILNLEASFYEEIFWNKNIAYVSERIIPRDLYVSTKR
ncbi:MAG TPA: hypothetical protein VKP78_11515 [bacterium]|nr:hypothetical protein [bacterium]